jgi:hypothetical protein
MKKPNTPTLEPSTLTSTNAPPRRALADLVNTSDPGWSVVSEMIAKTKNEVALSHQPGTLDHPHRPPRLPVGKAHRRNHPVSIEPVLIAPAEAVEGARTVAIERSPQLARRRAANLE